jgi:hypothetical protein
MVMKRKAAHRPAGGERIGVVNEGDVHGTLRRGPAKELSPEEDKVIRMRVGASPARTAPLERSFDAASELEIELRAAEIEAWMKWKARLAEREERERPAPTHSRTKEKIIRALRRK